MRVPSTILLPLALLSASGCWMILDIGALTARDGASVPDGALPEGAPLADASAGVVVARGLARPRSLVLDADALFFMAGDAEDSGTSARVARLARSEGATPTTLATNLENALDLTANATTLYWVEGTAADCSGNVGIGYVGKTGASRGFSPAPNCYAGQGVRAAEGDVYYLGGGGQIWRFAAATMANAEKLTAEHPDAGAMAVGPDAIYLAVAADRSIVEVERTTPYLERLFAPDQDVARAIVTDESRVYWVTSPAGTAASGSVGGAGQAPAVLSSTHRGANAVAVDRRFVYVTDASSGTLSRIDKAGGPAVVLLSAMVEPCSVVADDVAVYVADCAAGTITMLGP